jgi:F0F1-type ATP synthase assembly protein I
MPKKTWTAAEKKAFAERMKKARNAKRKKSRATTAKKSTPRKTKTTRPKTRARKAPVTVTKARIAAMKGKQLGFYTGRYFDTDASKAKLYTSVERAVAAAEKLNIPRGWKLGVEKISVKK